MQANRTLRYFSAHIKKLPYLTGKERYVLLKRIRHYTLETIGKKLGVTEGRIRQIEKSGIHKVRSKIHQQILFKLPKYNIIKHPKKPASFKDAGL